MANAGLASSRAKEFTTEWEDRVSSRGNRYRVLKEISKCALKTTSDNILSNIVYLYPSREAADNGRIEGGGGFIVALRSAVYPRWKVFPYIVTNRHVIESGASVVRVTTEGGGSEVLEFKPSDWKCSDSDDLAAVPLEASDCDVSPEAVAATRKPDGEIVVKILEEFDSREYFR